MIVSLRARDSRAVRDTVVIVQGLKLAPAFSEVCTSAHAAGWAAKQPQPFTVDRNGDRVFNATELALMGHANRKALAGHVAATAEWQLLLELGVDTFGLSVRYRTDAVRWCAYRDHGGRTRCSTRQRMRPTNHRGNTMNKQHLKGHAKEAEGKIKELTGKLVGNERLEEKGRAEKIAGRHEAARADLKDDIKKLADV
jgi:uncharacterized protein YjbJ (UPF0337 family)